MSQSVYLFRDEQNNDTVIGIERRSGKVKWKIKLPTPVDTDANHISKPLLTAFYKSRKIIYGINPDSGKFWTIPELFLNQPITAIITPQNRIMFFNFTYSQDFKQATHTILLTDLEGKILSPVMSYTANFLPGMSTSSPHIAGDYILARTTEGIKIFDIKSGNLIKIIPSKEPIYNSSYLDGVLIYQSGTPGKSGKLIGVQV